MLHRFKPLNKHNRGSTIMIALVVIIIFGMFAYALNKMKVDTASSFYNSLIYERATMVANSSLEKLSYYLYPIDGSAKSSCPSAEQLSNLAYADPMCNTELACELRSASITDQDQPINLNAFFIKATTTCNLGTDDDVNTFEVTKIITSQVKQMK